MYLQNGRCAVCQEALEIPRPKDLFKKSPTGKLTKVSYRNWIKSKNSYIANNAATVVRYDITEPWAPGNVILIIAAWEKVYLKTGGVIQLKRYLSQTSTNLRDKLYVPSAQAVADQIEEPGKE
jgi:hypothetical protein